MLAGLAEVEERREAETQAVAERVRVGETLAVRQRVAVPQAEVEGVRVGESVPVGEEERQREAEGERVDAAVADSGPNTVLMVTAVAAEYTESPVCVTVSVHVPPTAVALR
jgi:hypothetical protein